MKSLLLTATLTILSLACTDENGWKWEYELIPADGDGVNFTGIANGYKVN